LAGDEPSAGIVDEFWIVVLLHFAEVLLDLVHLFLAIFVLLLPWRALQLLCAVSETNKRAAWREAREIYQVYLDARDCLMDYKAGMVPLMNSLAKQPDEMNLNIYDRYGYYYQCPFAVTKRLKDLEQRTWKVYESSMWHLYKRASKSSLAVQELGEALKEVENAEEMRLRQWAFRTTFNSLSPSAEQEWQTIARRPPEAEDEQGSISALLVQVVIAAEAKADAVQKQKDMVVEEKMVMIL
jgi:hypothetical protein